MNDRISECRIFGTLPDSPPEFPEITKLKYPPRCLERSDSVALLKIASPTAIIATSTASDLSEKISLRSLGLLGKEISILMLRRSIGSRIVVGLCIKRNNPQDHRAHAKMTFHSKKPSTWASMDRFVRRNLRVAANRGYTPGRNLHR